MIALDGHHEAHRMQQDRVVRYPTTSFIVRVWNDDGSVPQMRGEIEHLGTGEKRFFLDPWALLSLIESWHQDLEVVH
jgi:hypothetical protein